MLKNYDYESGNSYDPIDYVQEDLCGNSSPFLDTDDIQHEYNPFCSTTKKEIGNTLYKISFSCQGNEPILEKMKRLLFNDSFPAQPQNEGET